MDNIWEDGELKVINKYAGLIEVAGDSEDSFNELKSALFGDTGVSFGITKKILLAVAILSGKKNVFIVRAEEQAPNLSNPLEGVLKNLTLARARGIPILPSLFKNHTPVIFYKIERNRIADSMACKLESKDQINEAFKTYNLLALDTEESKNSINRCFNGSRKFGVRAITTVTANPPSLETLVASDVITFADPQLQEVIDKFKSIFLGDIYKDYKLPHSLIEPPLTKALEASFRGGNIKF